MSSSKHDLLVDPKRVRKLTQHEKLGQGPVLYWMHTNMRVQCNWALISAYQLAQQLKQPLYVLVCLDPKLKSFFNVPTHRHLDFLIEGLKQVEERLDHLNIGLKVIIGEPKEQVIQFVQDHNIQNMVTDFNPLKPKLEMVKQVVKGLNIPCFDVDASHVIPLWESSDKQEFAAYTLRPKIHKKLSDFLIPFPKINPLQFAAETSKVNWEKVQSQLSVDDSVQPSKIFKPGEKEAQKVLSQFLNQKLDQYHEARNDPNEDALSNLSPYLHFGQISAQDIALQALKSASNKKQKDAFIEELIVRRELAANYCYYNPDYASSDGFPRWAKASLEEHLNDKREYLYTLKDFEQAQTHDPLWNAAQKELLKTGKMHGYIRMYWAKKILEWTPHYSEAFKIGLYLNDKYELDGSDPNGYVGVAWSVGGVHDRAWFERAIFGKIRYMNANGCRRKVSR